MSKFAGVLIGASLFYGGEKSLGWKVDYSKLLKYLKKKYSVSRFYLKLERFGYKLFLKPVKTYYQSDGGTQRKANCDVEMAFHLMKEKENYDKVVILSGDGDFLPVLKYLKKSKKDIIILSRGPRTAREIRQFAGSSFTDFVRLKKKIKFENRP